jgi:hypothetical protein
MVQIRRRQNVQKFMLDSFGVFDASDLPIESRELKAVPRPEEFA